MYEISNDELMQRKAYRTAAAQFLDLSEKVSGRFVSAIELSFVGAYVYMMDVPVTVYNISKQPICGGNYRTAKRYVDMMVDAGSFEYTEEGLVRCTEKGLEASDWYFRKLLEMPAFVAGVEPSIVGTVLQNERLSELLNEGDVE